MKNLINRRSRVVSIKRKDRMSKDDPRLPKMTIADHNWYVDTGTPIEGVNIDDAQIEHEKNQTFEESYLGQWYRLTFDDSENTKTEE
jgi:hypothetical protein